MTLFMVLTFYSCILMMLVLNLNDIKPKKNIVLGATIPYTKLTAKEVLTITEKYKKELIGTHIFLTILLIPCFFIPEAPMIFYLMTWLVIAITAQTLPFIKANKALRCYKKSIKESEHAAEKIVDLKLSTIEIKAASPYHSLIPFIISIIPVAYVTVIKPSVALKDMLFLYLSMSVTILLCMILHIIINRRSRDAATDNLDINKALSVIRKRNWAKMFIGLNYSLAFINIFMFCDITLSILSPSVIFFGICIFTVFVIIFSLYVDIDTRKKQYEYTNTNRGNAHVVVDEDEHWIFGMFYYNPNDNRIMIPDRVGSNTTVNIATTVGKITMIISALLIIAMPFFGAWFWYADEYPMTVEYTDTAIVASHISQEYVIPLDEIISKESLDECPKITSKINGWSTGNVNKGTFQTEKYGICEVFIGSDSENFYVIKTEDTTYILGE